MYDLKIRILFIVFFFFAILLFCEYNDSVNFFLFLEKHKDHGQSPIHSAQTLKACISESV